MKAAILVKFNQYESKRHFAHKMGEAFARAGIDATVYDTDSGSYIYEWEKGNIPPYDLVVSFNRFNTMDDGRYLWEKLKMPFVSILVDSAVYNVETFTTPHSFATCVDRDDLAFANTFGHNNVRFMPHAIEPELSPGNKERIYPVVLIGSCYDPDGLKAEWQRLLPPHLQKVVENAVDISFGDMHKPFLQATTEALAAQSLTAADVPFKQLYTYVDYFMRGYDRVALVRAIKDAPLHIFGGTCWRSGKPAAGWSRYTASQRNVTLHPATTFKESLDILQQSKICLNSIPTLRNGSHERVLASYACGALPISSNNIYWQEQFQNNIILYPYNNRTLANEKINELLHNEPLRLTLTTNGRQTTLQQHTWDQRVQQLTRFFWEDFVPPDPPKKGACPF